MKVHMDVIGGRYEPAVGRNTFRRFSNKYGMLMPGDEVLVCYKSHVDAEPFAVENLIVRAIARGKLSEMLKHHAIHNHAINPLEMGNRSGELLWHTLCRVYDDADMDEQFVVVYFH